IIVLAQAPFSCEIISRASRTIMEDEEAAMSRRANEPMNDETEEAIEEFLEGKPRAQELAEMVEALEMRRQSFTRERDTAPSDAKRKEWAARLREVETQIRALREEQAITGFVETSIRSAMKRQRVDVDDDYYP